MCFISCVFKVVAHQPYEYDILEYDSTLIQHHKITFYFKWCEGNAKKYDDNIYKINENVTETVVF